MLAIRFQRSCRECSHHSLEGHVWKERKCGVVGSDKRKEHDFAKSFYWMCFQKKMGEENGVFKTNNKRRRKKRKEPGTNKGFQPSRRLHLVMTKSKSTSRGGGAGGGKKDTQPGSLRTRGIKKKKTPERFANAFHALLPPGACQRFSSLGGEKGGAAWRGVQHPASAARVGPAVRLLHSRQKRQT